MENSKKKKIISISSIGVVVFIIILLLLLFFVTDMFKSPQQLFYKYLPQNAQLVEMLSSNLAISHEEKMKQNSYRESGEISFSYEMGNEESQETANSNEMLKIATEGKVDYPNQKQSNKVKITKNNQEILTVNYRKTNQLYALGSEEIVTKYVAVDMVNHPEELLNKMYTVLPNIVLATKMQGNEIGTMQEQYAKVATNVATIGKLVMGGTELTEEENNTISTKYLTFIAENISKKNFSKEKGIQLTIDNQNCKAEKYTLTYTTQELKDLMIKLLQQLQNDQETLTILFNKYQALGLNQEMSIDSFKQQIQSLEQTIIEQEIENEQIQISLYVVDNKLVKTEIGIGETLLSVQYINNTRENKVVIKNESANSQGFDTLEMNKSENEEQYGLSATLSSSNDAQNTISIQTSKVGNSNSSTFRNLTILTVRSQSGTYTLKQSNNINFEENLEIEEINQENSITLNTYSQEELQELILAIVQRVNQVWTEKMQQIEAQGEVGSSIENSPENEGQTEQGQQTELSSTEKLAIEMFNEQFLAYLGESVQADKVRELLKVTRTAVQNQNEIILNYSGTYNNTPIEKQISTIEEIEGLEIYVVNGKNYKVEGTADATGKLRYLTIKENTNNT